MIVHAKNIYLILQKIFFITPNLNNFARKYLVKGNEYLIKSPLLFDKELDEIKSEIGEFLLYHNGISFYVYGENIPLALLIRMFGVKGFECLLEQDAVQFVFNEPDLSYNVDEIPGILPLGLMTFSSKAHSDPEESVSLGLNWLSHPLHEKQKKRIIKKTIDVYRMPDKKIAENAAQFGYDSYNNDLFKEIGLPKNKELAELNQQERKTLCALAHESLTVAILSEFHYHTYDSFQTALLHKAELNYLNNAFTIEGLTDTLFSLEKLPNFKEMLRHNQIILKDIPELRSGTNSEKFRRWILSHCDHNDSKEITREH
jgi:hypothetical protein